MVEKKLLLHVCCAPCSTYAAEKLLTNYEVGGFFYNPNLYPADEHNKRREEATNYFKNIGREVFYSENYEHDQWLEYIWGLESEPEGGKRCLKCYFFRLEKTAQYAKKHKFDFFATTLTTSPYKKADLINKIGEELAKKYRLNFLNEDFKKQDGYLRSIELSKRHNLYRQNYCGCEFSLQK